MSGIARAIIKVATGQKTLEGGGIVVRRALGSPALPQLDPFLMLDHLGPMTFKPQEAIGFPDHPHRGQETVTYLLQGEFQHKDSKGQGADLKSGDVQWMTAGSGVLHSEMPSDRIFNEGGTIEGFQLWVNLPRKDKMIPARYQDVPASTIPEAFSDDKRVKVRVIAGSSLGKEAVIETRTPIMMLDVQLEPGASLVQPVPEDYTGFVYVYAGEGVFGSSNTAGVAGQTLALGPGSSLQLTAKPNAKCCVLLIAGRPLREPVAWHGPFVMNTQEEIEQAFDDYQNGYFGSIPGAKERMMRTEMARKKKAGH
mmetsp:Transcript_5263/g.9087  ORF Transcript_5263/g.9087 Transcript_5263/m.9087 type:complete len:310 (+) Transcript_5263:150-1079(+)|eukprot:CAMPEP_0196661736 /NCGR_PEP_ID=MMETSP1086-20130531/45676_1 /TAXON_ID=77921 /ORGANISM="Cyanoptyche  gloeocystis , Strain SAG4.97" /LENGTH=309 /DNA_ID=CAMNT_0041996771 /DNA_START=125 /DNA_END=1054 /DNA_ORIENTATION=+